MTIAIFGTGQFGLVTGACFAELGQFRRRVLSTTNGSWLSHGELRTTSSPEGAVAPVGDGRGKPKEDHDLGSGWSGSHLARPIPHVMGPGGEMPPVWSFVPVLEAFPDDLWRPAADIGLDTGGPSSVPGTRNARHLPTRICRDDGVD